MVCLRFNGIWSTIETYLLIKLEETGWNLNNKEYVGKICYTKFKLEK